MVKLVLPAKYTEVIGKFLTHPYPLYYSPPNNYPIRKNFLKTTHPPHSSHFHPLTLSFVMNDFLKQVDKLINTPHYEHPSPEITTDLNEFLPDNLDEQNIIAVPSEPDNVPSEVVQKLVTELNAQHLIYAAYPTLDKLKELVPLLATLSNQEQVSALTETNVILDKRGLPEFELEVRRIDTPDIKFVAALNLIMDIHDKRSVAAKLQDVGLSTKKWNALIREPRHSMIYTALVDKMMDETLWNESRVALSRNVSMGDLPSIKYSHALTGKFSDKQEFDPSIIAYFLTTILEIVTRHVDSVTARRIADEVDSVVVKEIGYD